jgi:hypothetical protein
MRVRDFYVDPRRFGVTTQTILFGGEEPAAIDSAEVTRSIRVTETKAIFEVLWHGQPAVAKCRTNLMVQRFD